MKLRLNKNINVAYFCFVLLYTLLLISFIVLDLWMLNQIQQCFACYPFDFLYLQIYPQMIVGLSISFLLVHASFQKVEAKLKILEANGIKG